jgi:hypothetical protein
MGPRVPPLHIFILFQTIHMFTPPLDASTADRGTEASDRQQFPHLPGFTLFALRLADDPLDDDVDASTSIALAQPQPASLPLAVQVRIDDPHAHNLDALATQGWHLSPYLKQTTIAVARLLKPIIWSLQTICIPSMEHPPVLFVFSIGNEFGALRNP